MGRRSFRQRQGAALLVRLRRRALGQEDRQLEIHRRDAPRNGAERHRARLHLYRPRDRARRRVPREDFRGFQRHGVGAPLPQHLRGEHPEDRAGEGRGHHPRIDSQGSLPAPLRRRKPRLKGRLSRPHARAGRRRRALDAPAGRTLVVARLSLFQRPTAHGRHGRSHRMDR